MIIPFNDPRVYVVLSTWVGISVIGILLMIIFRKRRHALAEAETKALAGKDQGATKDKAAENEQKKGGFWQKLGSYLLINMLFFILAWSPYEIYAVSVGYRRG